MTKGQIEKIYERYCYNKHEGELDRWEETLNKVDDEAIKKVFTTYGDEISCLSALENYIIEVLPEKAAFQFLGYKDLEDMRYHIGLKIRRTNE